MCIRDRLRMDRELFQDYKYDAFQEYQSAATHARECETTLKRLKDAQKNNREFMELSQLKAQLDVYKRQVILDPFSGSFTTSAVAVRLGRNAIGIDLNADYFEIGIRRTGISSEYNGKLLKKEKVRKTAAKSKYAVSYTHLDVYKRTGIRPPRKRRFFTFGADRGFPSEV